MAKNDFLPYRGTDQGNVLPAPEVGYLTAGSSFVLGEPVVVVAAGTLSECASGAATLDGIAAMSGDTVGATDPVGVYRTPMGMYTPTGNDSLPTTNDPTTFWRIRQRRLWIAQRFSTDGTGAALVVPALANIGDAVGIILNAGNWSIDGNAGTAKVARIVDVLDAFGDSIVKSAKTGSKAIFEFTLA